MRRANRTWVMFVLGCAVATGVSLGSAQAGPSPSVGPVTPLGGSGYAALTQARLLDTRPGSSTVDGLELGAGPLGANGVLDLAVLGRGGVPATGVGSVAVHVTAVLQTQSTFITVYPTGTARPNTSSLNPIPGLVASNTVIVPIGAGGQISLFNSVGSLQLIVDVVGWFPAGGELTTVTPTRLADTRTSSKVGAGQSLPVQVAGLAGVPTSGVSAVVLNVTTTSATLPTFLTAYPSGAAVPGTSNLNTQLGNIAANLVVTPMGADGKVAIRNQAGSVHVIVDVVGWFAEGPGYNPVTPTRIADTRSSSPLPANSSTTFDLTGVAGVPETGVGSVVFNLTAVNQTASTFLTVYPSGSPIPVASSLNPHPGVIAPNLVIAKVGPGGIVKLFNEQGTVDVILDVVGWLPSNVATEDDTLTVTEDDPFTVVDVLANDTDLDGFELKVQSVTQPDNGTAAVVNGGLGVSYKPDANYCNTPSDPADTFTYTLIGGASATVSATVTCVDDPPTAVDDGAVVTEDATVADIPVLANDTDVDAGPMTVLSTALTNNGTASPTGTGVDYLPNPNYCNTSAGTALDTFQYELNGGSTATVSVTVTCVNDAPTFALPASPNQSVLADSPAQTVAGFATSISKGPANESSQVLTFSVSNDANTLFTAQPDIDESTGALTYTPAPGMTGTATVSVYLMDNGGTANGGDDTSATLTFDITVAPLNATPVAQSSAVTTLEDQAKVVTLVATDADGDTLNFGVNLLSPHGQLDGLGAVVCGVTPNTCTTTITYTPDADYAGPDSFSFTVDDGTITSSVGTVSVTVDPVNDAPSFAKGADQTVNEDAGAQSTVGWATSLNKGAANESAQTLTFNITGNTNSALFSAGPAVSSTGTLTYTPAANANGVATVTLTVSDDGGTANGGADTSASQSFTITVAAVNDEPSFTKGGDQSLAEDSGAQSVLGWATAISRGPADESGQTLTFNITGNTNTGLFSVAPAVASNGTLTYTAAANKHGTATITLTLSDSGGTANGGDDVTASQSFVLTVTAVNDVPTSPGRAYGAASLQSNMQRSFDAASGLLVGAADAADIVGNAGYTPTLSVGAIEGFAPISGTITAAVPGVGTVVANAATGAFTIDPAPGVTGVVDFEFTVCDTGDGGPASQCSAPAVASFDITGPVIWFVNPAAVSNGVGTLASPFNTLAAADAVDAANHRIFVYTGTMVSGLTMQVGEWLIGQSATGTFDGLFGITPPANTLARPTIGSGTTTIGGTVTLATNARVQGTSISTGTSAGLAGSGGITGVSVSEASVTTTTGTAVSLDNAAGTYTLSAVTTNGAANGILLSNLGATTDISIASGAIVNASTRGIDINAGSGGITFGGTVTTTAAGRSVEVTNRTGGTVAFNGSVTDSGLGINLATNTGGTINFAGGVVASTGANPAFAATGGGTVSVTGASNTLATTTGSALNVTNTTIGATNLNFRSISANGATNGIVLNTTGASGRLIVTGNGGTCTLANTAGCTGGEIRNSTGVDDSSATPVGTGIILKDTLNPSFTRVWVHDHSNYAIRGTNVAGFTLADSVISGTNGSNDLAPFNDASVAFDNLTGSAAVTSSNIAGGASDNIRVKNTSGSLNRLTLTSVTVGANGVNGNDGVLLTSSGTATFNVTVQSSTFTSARGDLLQYVHGGSGTGDLVLNGNAFSNSYPSIATGGGGLSLFNEGTSGATTMTVTNNTFRDAVGHGVLIVKNTGTSTQTGTFSGNTIGVSGQANSGSKEGSALKLQTAGQGTLTWAVTSNQIFGYNNFGIEVLAGGGATLQSGNVNTTITGNTIAQPGNTAGTIALPKNGIHLNIGAVPGDTYQACAVIGGAGALANSIATSGLDGVPPTGAGDIDFRLRQRQSTTIRLPGYAGANNNDAAVLAFVAGNNGGNGVPVGLASNTVATGGGGFTGSGAGCP